MTYFDETVPYTWPTPVPFSSTVMLPPFPVSVMPPTLRRFVEEVAASRQVAPDLPAMLSLAVVGAAAAPSFEVNIGQTHTETLNLYVLGVLHSGERKTAAVNDAVLPLEHEERDRQRSARADIAVAEERVKTHEARLRFLRNRVGHEKEESKRTSLQCDLELLAREAPEVPAQPRLLANDITSEKLGSLLAENGGNMAIIDDEGGLFQVMAGLYNRGVANIALYLKGYTGAAVRVDRIGRTTAVVPRACLTLALAVQPDVLLSLNRTTAFRGQGLLARFFFCFPERQVGHRPYQDRRMDQNVKDAYEGIIRGILSARPTMDQDGRPLFHRLRIQGEALEVWRVYNDRVESEMAEGERLSALADWGSKIASGVARIAAGFHLAAHDADGQLSAEVAPQWVEAACAVGEYLEAHALHAFDLMDDDVQLRLARLILAWIERHQVPEFRQANCYEALRHRLEVKKSQDLDGPLTLLETHNYVVRREALTGLPGRPASAQYLVNPATFGG